MNPRTALGAATRRPFWARQSIDAGVTSLTARINAARLSRDRISSIARILARASHFEARKRHLAECQTSCLSMRNPNQVSQPAGTPPVDASIDFNSRNCQMYLTLCVASVIATRLGAFLAMS